MAKSAMAMLQDRAAEQQKFIDAGLPIPRQSGHDWVVQMVDETGERVLRTYQAAGMTERDAEIFCDRKQRQYPTKFFQMARREG